MKRERSHKLKAGSDNDDGSSECILLPSGEKETVKEQVAMKISVTLYKSDFEIIESSSMWLNERLTNAGQTMIKEKFPHLSGLQDVVRSDTCTFEEEAGNFVQILNCRNNHWICVANTDCKPNEVKI